MGPGSAIGRVTRLVVPLLQQSAEVDVWEPQEVARPGARFVLPRRHYVAKALEGYDAVFYNLGNHAPNHAGIWRASQAYPGIVIAHDVNLHALVRQAPTVPDRPDYLELLERTYGPQAREHARDAQRGTRADPPWALPHVARFPMLRATLTGARTVVVHSEEAARLVRREVAGAVLALPLPYARLDRPGAPLDRVALGLSPDRVVLLTVGHVLPDRHVALLVAAVGSDPRLRERCTVVTAGQVGDATRAALEASATKAGVDLQVRGQVEDAVLDGLLEAADVSVNLRHPHTESGSASLVEAMLHALPVVVMRSGPHAEVPPDAGAVITPTAGTRELAGALLPLVLDAQARRAAGQVARAHAETAHRPERYAAHLLELARFPTSGAPTAALLRTVATAARELGLPLDARIGAVLAETLLDVVGAPGADTGAPVLRR
jgi:glycosyltransferase involved in cell wall biosynthesis